MLARTAIILAALSATTALAHADVQRFAGDGFVVTATTAEPAVVGAPLTVELTLTATSGYKVNQDYPIGLELTTPADVVATKSKLGKADARLAHDAARFTVTLTPKAAGAKVVGAKFKFALCTDTTCEPRKHAVDLRLAVR